MTKEVQYGVPQTSVYGPPLLFIYISLYITLFNVVGVFRAQFAHVTINLNCSDQDRFISPVTVYDILTTWNVHHFELIYLQFVSMNSEALKHKKPNMVSVKVLFTVRRFFPFLFTLQHAAQCEIFGLVCLNSLDQDRFLSPDHGGRYDHASPVHHALEAFMELIRLLQILFTSLLTQTQSR